MSKLLRWAKSLWEFIAVLVGIGRPGLTRRLREASLARTLRNSLGAGADDLRFTWQPLCWILVKLTALSTLAAWVWSLHPRAAALLGRAIDFVKLGDVLGHAEWAAGLPSIIARWSCAAMATLIVAGPALSCLAAAFTSAAISPSRAVVYIYRDFIIWRGVETIRLQETQGLALEQCLPLRMVGLGDVVIRRRDGSSIRLRSLWGARAFALSVSAY
jgi:hypothetical protein